MSYPKQPSYPIQPTNKCVIQDDITQAINQNSYEACQEILKKDPLKVKTLGFNGMTPLHQSCLRGLPEITKLFLEYQADINAKSDFEETPLHYACRRGDVRIIHLLVSSGSTVDVVDKQGSGCMHYATQGGSIIALEYLRQHTNLSYNTQNHLGETPLHISCQLRNQMMTHYLLRKSRCEVCIRNNKGMTVLHIAAQLGDAELCWRLITIASCKLCHIKDNAGNTALDMAKRELTDRHKRLTEQLEYYSKLEPTSYPKGPTFTWFCLLFLPFTWAAVVFALSTFLNSHSGLFALVMFVVLVIYVSRQGHRIPHPSRWPNPIFLGGFSGGIFHCIIGAYFILLPDILSSRLWPCPWSTLLITVLCTLCVYNLRKLVFENPGIVRNGQTTSDGRQMGVMNIVLENCRESDFCPYTEKIKPPQTKYCRICEHLIEGLDHHCLFLNNCIAKLNHKNFVIFLLIVMALQVIFVLESLLFVSTTSCSESVLMCLYHNHAWVFDLTLLCTLSFLWESMLVGSQLINISKGQTEYYKRHHHKITAKEALVNLFRFFITDTNGKREIVREKQPLLIA